MIKKFKTKSWNKMFVSTKFIAFLYIFTLRKKDFFKREVSHSIKVVLIAHIISNGGKNNYNLDGIFQY